MRQLVSVVADGRVRYFIHDGDDVRQIAEITDPGTNVATVIEIGVSLGALYERRNGAGAQPAKRAKPAPAAKSSTPRTTSTPGKRPTTRWGASRDRVLADLRSHPDTSYVEIAERVAGSGEHRARGTVTATIGDLRKSGHRIESRRSEITDVMGRSRPGVRLTLIE